LAWIPLGLVPRLALRLPALKEDRDAKGNVNSKQKELEADARALRSPRAYVNGNPRRN
jgi:hypothetical protein